MRKSRIYKFLKGFFRVQTGFAAVRIWSLDRVYPRKTNVHLFDLFHYLINRKRQKKEKI